MEKSTKNKKIKNYLILFVIFIISIGIILYICELYKVNQEEKRKIPVISGVLSEIYSTDLDHYILDNPTTVIYMCTATDDTCRLFERDLKKLLKKKDYGEQIVYLNLTDINQDEFVNNFNNTYKYKMKLTTDYPAFVLFEDGNVKSVLQGNKEKKLDLIKVKQFLELNKIGE